MNQTLATETPGAGDGSQATSTPFTGTAVGQMGSSFVWVIFAGITVGMLSLT